MINKIVKYLGVRRWATAGVAALVLAALVLAPSAALALSAGDLIVVYNRNLPESQGVAAYYAAKRRVPADNLVGAAVSTSEDMSRADFDKNLAPPVRAAVEKLKATGRTPALLLVYGIPLRVGGVAATGADKPFHELAAAKAAEYQDLVLQLVRRLDGLTPGLPKAPGWKTPAPRVTYSTRHVLEMAQESHARGMAYLEKQPEAPARDEIMTVLIKLGGTSPEGRALQARAARSQGRGHQDFLDHHDVMGTEVQEAIFRGILPDNALTTAAAIRVTNGLMGELKFWDDARQLYKTRQTMAAVDSEMTLIMAGTYQPAGWLPNPFNLRFERLPAISRIRARTLMVGRLDGPTPAVARRLVDDALATERQGLTGVFYIDARGLTGKEEAGNYVWFDHHLVHVAEVVQKFSGMKLVLDKAPGLMAPGSAPDAALYCGWYSLAKYVPAFAWKRGAVGYHVASSEATTLKKPGSQVWCKRMLEEGVAATLGPVAEPYLFSFPLPDQFFPLLMTGEPTLLEAYFLTVPQVSWMQILIGDPLYRPFKQNPAIDPGKIRREAVPGRP